MFSKEPEPLYILPSSKKHEGSNFPKSSPTLAIIHCFSCSHSSASEVVSLCGSHLHFLMTNYVLVCLLWKYTLRILKVT